MRAKHGNRCLFRRTLMASAASLLLAGAAHAQEAKHRFDIPAGDAASALREFGRQSGTEILFPYDDAVGRRSPAIRGELNDRAVLTELAARAGLVVLSNDGRTVTLVSSQKQAAPRATPIAAVMGFTAPSASEPAAGTDTQPSAIKEVVVTARRRAIENATEIKRNSDTVVDAVVADEAGKLPDTSVTEVLQRVPGVTMSRFADLGSPDQYSFEGSGVQVRGLSGVMGLLNGREVFSANGGKGLNWGDVTPELMASVDVFKASRADLIEGGTGGTIDLRTRMPFDYKKPEIDLSLSGSYGDFTKHTTPSASVLVTDRWQTPVGEFGALLDLAYSDFKSADSFERIEPYFQTQYQGKTVYAPGGFDYGNDQFDRTRKGAYAAFQWRPMEGLTIWQTDFVSSYKTVNWSEGVYPVSDASDIVVNGTFNAAGVFQGGTMEGTTPTAGFAPGSGNSQSISTNTTADFSQGFDWRATDRLRLNGAFQFVDSSSDANKYGLGLGNAAPAQETFNLSGSLPSLGFANTSTLTNPATANISDIIWYHVKNKAQMGAVNLDAEYDLGDGFFKKVRVGGRYADRRESDDFVGTGWSAAGHGWNGVPSLYVATSPKGDFDLYSFPNFFKGARTAPSSYWFASPSILQASAYLHDVMTYTSCSPTGYHQCSNPAASTYLYGNPPDPNFGLQPSFSDTRTKSSSAYAMVGFGSDGFGFVPKFSGNFGVRVVHDYVTSTGNFLFTGNTTYYQTLADANASLAQVGGIAGLAAWQSAHPGQQLPLTYTSQTNSVTRSDSNAYTEVLPSLNIAFKPDRAWIVRVAVNQTMTPPNYNDIREQGSGSIATVANPNNTGSVTLPAIFNGYTYTSGDTKLKPAVSTNEDLTVEWYPSRSTTAHIDLFNKDIKNLIIYNNLGLSVDDAFGGASPLSIPTGGGTAGVTPGVINGAADYNATKISTVRGFELGGRTYFDMLPGALRGLGIEANFTYIDSHSPDARATDMTGKPISDVPIVALSKYNYNINLLYDLGPWDIRLAYNWRSRYLATTTGNGTTNSYTLNGSTVSYSLPVYGSATGQLDGSLSYRINSHVQVAVNLTNILNEVSRTEMEILPGQFVGRSWFLTDRRLALALRANF